MNTMQQVEHYDYYECCAVETFTHTDPDDAVEAYLDSVAGCTLPETVVVHRYRRNVISKTDVENGAESSLGQLLENFDEEYGDPDEGSICSDEMKSIMLEATQKIADLYTVWHCDEVGEPIEVDTAAWIREHAPNWMENEQTRVEVERLEKKAKEV